MKWGEPLKHNDARIVRHFLWWPMLLKGEWRWLEMATWRQKYNSYDGLDWWENIEWVDEKKESSDSSNEKDQL